MFLFFSQNKMMSSSNPTRHYIALREYKKSRQQRGGWISPNLQDVNSQLHWVRKTYGGSQSGAGIGALALPLLKGAAGIVLPALGSMAFSAVKKQFGKGGGSRGGIPGRRRSIVTQHRDATRKEAERRFYD